jgi:hypothetical protein
MQQLPVLRDRQGRLAQQEAAVGKDRLAVQDLLVQVGVMVLLGLQGLRDHPRQLRGQRALLDARALLARAGVKVQLGRPQQFQDRLVLPARVGRMAPQDRQALEAALVQLDQLAQAEVLGPQDRQGRLEALEQQAPRARLARGRTNR